MIGPPRPETVEVAPLTLIVRPVLLPESLMTRLSPPPWPRIWNDAASRLFGYRETEALGQSLDLIIPDRLRDRHWQGYEHVMKGGKSRYG